MNETTKVENYDDLCIMVDDATSYSKADLRAIMLSRRQFLSEHVRAEMDCCIADYLLTVQEVITAQHLHSYLPIASLAEVNTVPALERFVAIGKQLSVPVVQHGDLLSVVYHPGEELHTAKFGQPEPKRHLPADESTLDVVLVPLLAFDRQGYRLGYGKGMYDRFLQRLASQGNRPFRLGVSYLQQQLGELPVDVWDEPLDAIVHEKGFIRYT